MANMLQPAKESTKKVQDRNKSYTDSKCRADPGDLVWVKSHQQSKAAKQFTAKFPPKRDGPYVILQKRGPSSYENASTDAPSVSIGIHHTSALTPVNKPDGIAIEPVNPIRRRGRPRKQ